MSRRRCSAADRPTPCQKNCYRSVLPCGISYDCHVSFCCHPARRLDGLRTNTTTRHHHHPISLEGACPLLAPPRYVSGVLLNTYYNRNESGNRLPATRLPRRYRRRAASRCASLRCDTSDMILLRMPCKRQRTPPAVSHGTHAARQRTHAPRSTAPAPARGRPTAAAAAAAAASPPRRRTSSAPPPSRPAAAPPPTDP